MGSRKRSATDAELDPNAYVEEYLTTRGIQKTYNNSDVQRAVLERAVLARENFKRLRTSAADDGGETAAAAATGLSEAVLTPAEKYTRRLHNNRKSAAAARVYHEVHKYETAYTLNEVVTRSKDLEKENEKAKHRAALLREEIDQVRREYADLQKNSALEVQRLRRESAGLRRERDELRAAAAVVAGSEEDEAPELEEDVHEPISQLRVSTMAPLPGLSAPIVPTMPKMALVSSADVVASAPMSSAARVVPALFRASQDNDPLKLTLANARLNSQLSQSQEEEDVRVTGATLRRMHPLGSSIRVGSMNSQDAPLNFRASMDFEHSHNANVVLSSQEEFANDDFLATSSVPLHLLPVGLAAS